MFKFLILLILLPLITQAQTHNFFSGSLQGQCRTVQESCHDFYLKGCRASTNYRLKMYDGSVKSVACKMISSDPDNTKIGGWTTIIKNSSTSLSELAFFGSTANLTSTYMTGNQYGVTWGANDDKIKSFSISNFRKYSKGMVTITGFYDSEFGVTQGSNGLGLLFISNTNQNGVAWDSSIHGSDEKMYFGDGNANASCYQGLTINGVLQGTTGVYCDNRFNGKYSTDIINLTTILDLSNAAGIYHIQMTGYNSGYLYNRRFIKEFLVK